MSMFEVALESFIDMNHELVLLSRQIDWVEVESDFAEYYCADNGRPSVPIRTMVGMMLLKSIYNLSDEGVVARWLENPYMQYFTGERVFQNRPPMNPIDMTKFRKRIGESGAEKIFKLNLTTAAACNMRHWRNKYTVSLFVSLLMTLVRCLENTIFENKNQYACKCSRLAIVAW